VAARGTRLLPSLRSLPSWACVIFLAYSASSPRKRRKPGIGQILLGGVSPPPADHPHHVRARTQAAGFRTAMLMLMLFCLLVFCGRRQAQAPRFHFLPSPRRGGYLLLPPPDTGWTPHCRVFMTLEGRLRTPAFSHPVVYRPWIRRHMWGTGLGNGRQKLFTCREPHTTFIFSILGEELGFFGACLIILLFGLLIYCGIKICLQGRRTSSAPTWPWALPLLHRPARGHSTWGW